ncbi:MFS transporter [Paenibacillus silvae]|jgi:FSR family fosmidomycin resistance protein-like MFS transporter|uniref:MFS transporter n=1 Tax=Paenibacillus silvae TaxID=1325358 RepID=UPI0025A1181A|nr:MFS transporter [Paenibacillus silvae]MDM5280903.1 MFS transporter [Paenibacillus silvae]
MAQAALNKIQLNHSANWALAGVSFAHLLNDAMQTVVTSAFPLFQQAMQLSFAQMGWIAFALNITASVLQPLVGYISDRRPMPFLLPGGMLFSLFGILGFAFSSSLWMLLVSASLIGIGSSILHPESSRVAHLAAGRGRGMAQSIFQVGGNTGQALAPLLVAFVLLPHGQLQFLWLMVFALIGIVIQASVSRWYKNKLNAERIHRAQSVQHASHGAEAPLQPVSRRRIVISMSVLILLLFSKFVYIAAMTGYYAFYYTDVHHLPLSKAQLCLFILQFAGMLGTLLGGPLADRFGRKPMIWFSIAGTAPFSLLLPYAGPVLSMVLCGIIGLILMSGFSVIIVYAQELLPRHIGTVSGLFFGLSFGMAGLGSVVIGSLIDMTSLSFVIRLCSFLPLIGVCAVFLRRDQPAKA